MRPLDSSEECDNGRNKSGEFVQCRIRGWDVRVAHLVKMIIAGASIAVTALARGLGLRWGNRFAIVAAPGERPAS